MAEFVYMLFFFTCRYFIKYLKCNRNSVVFIKNNYRMETDISNNIIHDNSITRQDKNIEKPSILLLSSLFFITNIVTAYFNEQYLYSFLFFILTITSLVVHYNDNFYTNVIDKIAVLSIVLYGGYVLCNKINTNKWLNLLIIIVAFLLCIYLYIYGFIVKEYCFCDKKCIAENYHFVMHVISSIGHHFIIYL